MMYDIDHIYNTTDDTSYHRYANNTHKCIDIYKGGGHAKIVEARGGFSRASDYCAKLTITVSQLGTAKMDIKAM